MVNCLLIEKSFLLVNWPDFSVSKQYVRRHNIFIMWVMVFIIIIIAVVKT